MQIFLIRNGSIIIQAVATYFLHHHFLALPDKLILGLHYRLKELQVLHMLPVCFYAVHKVLYHLGVDFIAQRRIVLENAAHCLGLAYARIQEQIQLLVQQHLILLIPQAEVLQEIVRQSHQLVHSNVFFGVEWNLQQI